MVWQRVAGVVTGRLAWLLALTIVLTSGALMAISGTVSASSQSPISVPTGSDSAKAAVALRQFSGGDQASAILIVTRRDASPLTPAGVPMGIMCRLRPVASSIARRDCRSMCDMRSDMRRARPQADSAMGTQEPRRTHRDSSQHCWPTAVSDNEMRLAVARQSRVSGHTWGDCSHARLSSYAYS
jgi:hypothetical protein